MWWINEKYEKRKFFFSNGPLQITKFGGYKMNKTNIEGIYLDFVPSIAWFVTGTATLFIPTNTSEVLVCNEYDQSFI